MRNPTVDELSPPPPDRVGWPWTEESPQLPETRPDGLAWPRISIITPSYNQGRFIEETIRSVLLQGYPNLEYIITDGGSTDGSIDIMLKYANWLAHWSSEPDNGQSDAINRGFARSTGDIVAWVNTDDLLLPGALHSVVETFAADPRVGLVYGDDEAIDADGTVLLKRVSPDFRLERLVLGNWIAQGFVRRSLIQSTELVDDRLRFYMDWELWLRIASHASAQRVPEVLAQVRFHEGAKTVSSVRIRSEQWSRQLEYKMILDRLYSQPYLPRSIECRRRECYAKHQYAMGVNAYDLGDRGSSFRWITHSLLTSPHKPHTFKRVAWLTASLLPAQWVVPIRRRFIQRRAGESPSLQALSRSD